MPKAYIQKSVKKGRPTVMTPSIVGKLEQAFMYDCTVEEACVYAGIHKDTYYEFCKQNPEFSDKVTALRFYPILVARRAVVNAIVGGNLRLAMRYLERKRPQEFSSRGQSQNSKWQEKTGGANREWPNQAFLLFERKAGEACDDGITSL